MPGQMSQELKFRESVVNNVPEGQRSRANDVSATRCSH